MKKFFKKNNAFTMAEVMIVLAILSIIAIFTMRIAIVKKAKYANKFLCYSALTTLQDAASEIEIAGCTAADVTSSYCDSTTYLPKVAHNGGNRGLCDRLADLFNTVGTVDCTQTATDANFATTTTATPNFTTTNGMIFYNLGTSADGNNLFNVYIDIDGTRRLGILNTDVIKFTINDQNAVVLPYYNSVAATSQDYLATSVGYRDNTGKYTWIPAYSNIHFYDAYCAAYGTYPNKIAACTQDTTYCNTHACDVKVTEPTPFF